MATRWLTTEQQRAWRSYIEAVRLLQEALDAQLQADAGMPHAYYEILVRLSEVPGRRRGRPRALAGDGTAAAGAVASRRRAGAARPDCPPYRHHRGIPGRFPAGPRGRAVAGSPRPAGVPRPARARRQHRVRRVVYS